jgi:hypothetical protein
MLLCKTRSVFIKRSHIENFRRLKLSRGKPTDPEMGPSFCQYYIMTDMDRKKCLIGDEIANT